MSPTSARVLLLLLFFSPLVAAANFTQCLGDFKKISSAVGGVDSQGRPTSPAAAVGFTYQTCTARCGTGWESPNWRTFTQLFASWLLPWLALLSQLPFGSSNYADDFISIIMSLGSPALAAYSLVLTSLNARSVYHKVEAIKYEHKRSTADALISIQQIPLELTDDPRLLEFIPHNDRWIQEIEDRLGQRNVWSIATGASIVWVIIAFLFTLVDSFISINDTVDVVTAGHAIGTIWLWLLCLVIGWLWVPALPSHELKSALSFANQQTVKRTVEARREAREKTRKVTGSPEVDPSHHESTVPFETHSEGQQDHDHLTVSVNPNANRSVVSMDRSTQPSIDPETDELFIPLKRTSLNRDEHRLSATFNYSRIMRYLALVDDVLRALDRPALEKANKRRSAAGITSTLLAEKENKAVFPPRALTSMFNAAIMALVLQCGTTVAAVVIVYYIPPPGFGCRSLGYLIYGGVAIAIMLSNITSTILARISETREKSTVKDLTAFIAIALRRISFILALINGTGLVVLSCFQFANFLDTCYCNASAIEGGTGSYILVIYDGSTTVIRNSRLVATLLSAVVMTIYMVFIRFMTLPPGGTNSH